MLMIYLIDNGRYWTDGSRLMFTMRLNSLRKEYPGYTDWDIFNEEAISRFYV